MLFGRWNYESALDAISRRYLRRVSALPHFGDQGLPNPKGEPDLNFLFTQSRNPVVGLTESNFKNAANLMRATHLLSPMFQNPRELPKSPFTEGPQMQLPVFPIHSQQKLFGQGPMEQNISLSPANRSNCLAECQNDAI